MPRESVFFLYSRGNFGELAKIFIREGKWFFFFLALRTCKIFILESTVLLIEFSIVTMECTDNVKVWNQSLEITVRYHQRRRDEEPVNDGGFSDPTPMEVDETPMEGDETPMEVDETPMEGDDSDSTPMEVDVSGNSTVTTPSMDDVEDTTPMLTQSSCARPCTS